VHTTEAYDVDGVKYFVLGGGGADGLLKYYEREAA
jgi:hypothetical protein